VGHLLASRASLTTLLAFFNFLPPDILIGLRNFRRFSPLEMLVVSKSDQTVGLGDLREHPLILALMVTM